GGPATVQARAAVDGERAGEVLQAVQATGRGQVGHQRDDVVHVAGGEVAEAGGLQAAVRVEVERVLGRRVPQQVQHEVVQVGGLGGQAGTHGRVSPAGRGGSRGGGSGRRGRSGLGSRVVNQGNL